MQNLGNVLYICGSPFVMSRTDAQNGLFLGADYMDRASPVNRAEKCHENLPWAAK